MQQRSTGYFFIPLTLLCLAYFGFQLFFNQYAMISVDEFWFAHRIYEYKDGLPYRDFAPYKTIIGYYLLLVPMLFSHGIIKTLIFTKNAIALCNTLILFISSAWLTRYFSRKGVLCSLALLLCMEIMLTYSSNIRVDLLAYWFCLFSLLFLFENRFITAGILIGLGFATSQKAVWYLFASNAALGVHWLFTARNRQYFINCVKFNVAATAVIITYLLLWSLAGGWHTVYNSVFVEASAMYHLDWYNATRHFFWSMILLFNPLTFLLWPLTIISLMVTYKKDNTFAQRRFAIIYAFTILLCLLPYKQVFPYYMQVTIPAFLVLYAAFFTWMIELFQNQNEMRIISKKGLFFAILAYSLGIIASISTFNLPFAYLLVCFIPVLFGVIFLAGDRISPIAKTSCSQLIILNIIFIGMVYPLAVYTAKVINLNGNYQKANLAAINTLLRDGSDYTAGIELIYNKKQPIAGLRHLMAPAIAYLYQPSKKLLPVMTASLYEDPNATIETVNAALEKSRVKFYVNNYRMNALPREIKDYLASQYTHYWGSIYLYAPTISAGTQQSNIKFPGEYTIHAKKDTPVMINGKQFKHGDHIILQDATMTSKSETSFRLRLVPSEQTLVLNPAYKKDEWQRMIY